VSFATPASVRADDAIAQCIAASERGLDLKEHGKLLEARTVLAACASPSCGAEIKETCEKRIVEANERIPKILFDAKDPAGADIAGVTVTVDGGVQIAAANGQPIELDPGRHVFRFEASGRAAVERVFVLDEKVKDRRERITLATQPSGLASAAPSSLEATTGRVAAPVRSASTSGAGPLPWVFGGIGVASLGLGSFAGIQALSLASTIRNNCPNHICVSDADMQTASDGKTWTLVSTVGFAVGAAALAGAAYLWLRGSGKQPEHAGVWMAPWGGASSGGIAAGGRFQ
jgi:hypothetical protein